MKILLVSLARRDANAGASRVYHLLSDGLASRGHHVRTYHYDSFNIPQKMDRIANRFLMPQIASYILEHRLKIENADVLMTSNGMLYPLFKRLRGGGKRPLLVNHNHGLSFANWEVKTTEAMRGHISMGMSERYLTGMMPVRWDRSGTEFADLTIVQNQRDMDYLLDQGFKSIVSLPLPVHPELLEAGPHTLAPVRRNRFSILWFGSWIERKGAHYVPRAFEMIVKRFPQASLTVWGGGSAERILGSFAPFVREKVKVVPKISLKEQIASFDSHSILLFPSLSEGFGFALLEAMTMGLAAVTTMTGAGADWLEDRTTGLMVPTVSSIHLANAVIRLMEDDALRCRIAEQGQLLARKFTIERFVDSYANVFEERLAAMRSKSKREPEMSGAAEAQAAK